MNDCNNLPGPPGPRGIQGKIGPEGPRGYMGQDGPAGPPGVAGRDGYNGEKGSKGEPGIKGNMGLKGEMGLSGKNNNLCLTFGASNLGNIPNLLDSNNNIIDEGFMFPGYYDGLINFSSLSLYESSKNYLSSGRCLANIRNIDNKENIFTDIPFPFINIPFKKRSIIKCLSYSTPNIIRKKRSSIYLGIVIMKMELNNVPLLKYYGDEESLSNIISNKPIDLHRNLDYKVETVIDDEKLFYIDLNEKQSGKISVNDIIINEDEVVGIYIKVKNIIKETNNSKIGEINSNDPKYFDYIRPFIVNIHITEE